MKSNSQTVCRNDERERETHRRGDHQETQKGSDNKVANLFQSFPELVRICQNCSFRTFPFNRNCFTSILNWKKKGNPREQRRISLHLMCCRIFNEQGSRFSKELALFWCPSSDKKCAILLDLCAPTLRHLCNLQVTPQTSEVARFRRQGHAVLQCDLRVWWKIASDLPFWPAISKHDFCGNSGDLVMVMPRR